MKKSLKLVNTSLSAAIILSSLTTIIANNNLVQALNKNNSHYTLQQGEWVLTENNDYVATIKVIDKIGYVNIQLKNEDINTIPTEKKNKYIKEVEKAAESLKQDRIIPIVGLAISVVGLAIALDVNYIKPKRDEHTKVTETYNGWVSLNDNNKTLWIYKENGKFKRGWHWDTQYKAWYYFYDVKISSGYNHTNATLMYSARYNPAWLKLNNKWYEFQQDGKLILHSGWRKYNNKWLYHIPGDYGAAASQTLKIDGKYYTFDSNGYWV